MRSRRAQEKSLTAEQSHEGRILPGTARIRRVSDEGTPLRDPTKLRLKHFLMIIKKEGKKKEVKRSRCFSREDDFLVLFKTVPSSWEDAMGCYYLPFYQTKSESHKTEIWLKDDFGELQKSEKNPPLTDPVLVALQTKIVMKLPNKSLHKDLDDLIKSGTDSQGSEFYESPPMACHVSLVSMGKKVPLITGRVDGEDAASDEYIADPVTLYIEERGLLVSIGWPDEYPILAKEWDSAWVFPFPAVGDKYLVGWRHRAFVIVTRGCGTSSDDLLYANVFVAQSREMVMKIVKLCAYCRAHERKPQCEVGSEQKFVNPKSFTIEKKITDEHGSELESYLRDLELMFNCECGKSK